MGIVIHRLQSYPKPMARRAKAKRVRRRKSFSITNAAFSLGYANIISSGLFGTNILAFVLGKTTEGYGASPGFVSGPGLGIKELIDNPGNIEVVAKNAMKNLPTMVTSGLVLSVSERLFKRLMRAPLANVNRNIMKPLLGAGIKL